MFKFKFFHIFSKKLLTNLKIGDILIIVVRTTPNMREWRNWQTRTFEGRVDSPYGFKSRFSHHKGIS